MSLLEQINFCQADQITHVKNKIYFLHHLVRFIEGEGFHVTKQESFDTQVI